MKLRVKIYLGIIQLLYPIGYVCISMRINEQIPHKHMFKRDWTMSSHFFKYTEYDIKCHMVFQVTMVIIRMTLLMDK
jgi:uncharacterized membrane protein